MGTHDANIRGAQPFRGLPLCLHPSWQEHPKAYTGSCLRRRLWCLWAGTAGEFAVCLWLRGVTVGLPCVCRPTEEAQSWLGAAASRHAFKPLNGHCQKGHCQKRPLPGLVLCAMGCTCLCRSVLSSCLLDSP